ncbi:DUF2920 family protein [Bacillus xiapuensis]|uniref:DUF2920 family protein n=1 Tax=Bacillus xiapuensis TaxID=2014075 RepID=UPI000C2368F7|nr:DUF2920 family protein [Bacillus xiapuensis]
MSKDYQLSWPAHPNLYQNENARELTIYFSEPDQGVNKETGMLLLIPGFGGSAHSNVYKKMRSLFADQYNLITIQCDYFGQQFMQGSESVNIQISEKELRGIFTASEIERIYAGGFDASQFITIGRNYDLSIRVKENLKETLDNFNDMGIMQAIDHITAIHYVMKILEDNGLLFNTKRIILFGQSHGAYLSYLCNALAPDLFSLLIDNSSWLFPNYLKSPRYLLTRIGKMTLQIEFDYLASRLDYDEEFLDLSFLYQTFHNRCHIECFHGTTDHLISHVRKRKFCESIHHCWYHEISDRDVDGEVFKSTNHGLDADFLKLFDAVITNHTFSSGVERSERPVRIQTSKRVYNVDYSEGLPVVKVES